MSAPVPSPSMKGMIGSSGTTSTLFLRVIAVPLVGGLSVVKFGIFLGQVTCGTRKISANTVENSVEKASRYAAVMWSSECFSDLHHVRASPPARRCGGQNSRIILTGLQRSRPVGEEPTRPIHIVTH